MHMTSPNPTTKEEDKVGKVVSKKNTREQLSVEKLSKRRKVEEKWYSIIPKDLSIDKLPYCIPKNNVSEEEFEEAMQEDEKRFWKYDNGKVWIYEIPTKAHDRGSRTFSDLMTRAQIRANIPDDECLQSGGSGACGKGKKSHQPDEQYVPKGKGRPQYKKNYSDANGAPWPNLVVEVGYAQELSELDATRAVWFDDNSTVRILVLIKLWKFDTDNRTMRMMAETWLRYGHTPHSIEFGTIGNNGTAAPGCNQAGLPNFQIKLPVAELWYGDKNGVPQSLTSANPPITDLYIDLYQIQQAVLHCFPM